MSTFSSPNPSWLLLIVVCPWTAVEPRYNGATRLRRIYENDNPIYECDKVTRHFEVVCQQPEVPWCDEVVTMTTPAQPPVPGIVTKLVCPNAITYCKERDCNTTNAEPNANSTQSTSPMPPRPPIFLAPPIFMLPPPPPPQCWCAPMAPICPCPGPMPMPFQLPVPGPMPYQMPGPMQMGGPMQIPGPMNMQMGGPMNQMPGPMPKQIGGPGQQEVPCDGRKTTQELADEPQELNRVEESEDRSPKRRYLEEVTPRPSLSDGEDDFQRALSQAYL